MPLAYSKLSAQSQISVPLTFAASSASAPALFSNGTNKPAKFSSGGLAASPLKKSIKHYSPFNGQTAARSPKSKKALAATLVNARRAIDTNVLVRLITRDDLRQAASADAFIENAAWVSLLALAEAIWVLGAVYQLNPSQLAIANEMVLDHKSLTVQDPDIAASALARFRSKPTVAFSDCLLRELAPKAGQLPVGTFDHRRGWD